MEKLYYAFYKSYNRPYFYVLSIKAKNVDEAKEKAISYILRNVGNPQEAYIVNAKLGRWVRLYDLQKN